MNRTRHDDASLLSSTSAPASTTHDATTTTTTTIPTGLRSFQQQREAQLRHALQHASPTPAEVSAVASASYVQALMELIDQHSTDVQQVTSKIDALRAQREAYHADLARELPQREADLQELRNECSDLTLQVQEEQERSTRLLHEATVLHTQQAAQREQLGRLVELCRARGKRLRAFYYHMKGGGGARGSRFVEEDERGLAEGDVEAGRALSSQPATFADDGIAAVAARSPVVKPSSAPPSVHPVSLSIHKASCGREARPFLGSGGGVVSMQEIGDDAELAAILNLPYKVCLPRTPPSSPSPSSAAPLSPHDAATTASGFTVTANAASTAQLLARAEEVNMLRQQLEEQRGAYEQERGARTREDNERHRRAQEQLARYAATVEQLESLHEESLRELVQYRHHSEKQLRDVRGQVEWLRVALQNALELAEKDRRQQHNEVYATEQRMSKQYYPKVQSLHSELAEYRRVSAAQARDHAAAIAQKDEQIAALQQRLKAETTQRRRAEERHVLEMKGVHSELDLMRQSLRQMERRVYYRGVRDQASDEAEVELERYYY
ncbi:hypothetical protein ABB37_07367 [Leptomonas pyrrhocoris]|uniref:Uncharacterized protein n=1 Tax=Leptomonas pyrrhocoris TaxID=157538 RepID=A0A0M9FVT0_LEPPY|nr:hypothetical protein ABB37_07367 [Leptomonas pyrrhocoris]XP_015655453.1 hypothetical protein ABB37_07367 [Leptomonas pyrrhocoris]KPA77013.1 hypothetical protein ABB37_07367 [Leptomonas pyrrhocoris]KPA77014.1 hypothetical protein ABB37_07367 [Leptomonas pyrrhocoris]|eukprot:XP_015655452.1 hypothetical protein ABB37_07367 [Leptomonas pyrrhocoris]